MLLTQLSFKSRFEAACCLSAFITFALCSQELHVRTALPTIAIQQQLELCRRQPHTICARISAKRHRGVPSWASPPLRMLCWASQKFWQRTRALIPRYACFEREKYISRHITSKMVGCACHGRRVVKHLYTAHMPRKLAEACRTALPLTSSCT